MFGRYSKWLHQCPERNPLPESLSDTAVIPGKANARYWADEPPPETGGWYKLTKEELKTRYYPVMAEHTITWLFQAVANTVNSVPVLLLLLAVFANVTSVQAASAVPNLSAISDSDIRSSAVAFVNTSTSPGLEGATIEVDTDNRDSKQWRSSLGFSAEFTIKKHIFNGFWGLAIVSGSLEDQLFILSDTGEEVELDVKRDVLGLRGSVGLSFPISQYFKLRPFLSLGVSDLQTKTIIDGLPIVDPVGNTTTLTTFDTSAYMASTTGTLDAVYSRWFNDNRLELLGEYNLIYADSISGDNSVLNTTAWSQTALVKARYSGTTNLVSAGRPWRWQVYANHTNFLSFDKASLGYTGLFEIGTGLDWHLNIKPLNWFGWQTVGISVGVITSRNVEGYNFGLTAR